VGLVIGLSPATPGVLLTYSSGEGVLGASDLYTSPLKVGSVRARPRRDVKVVRKKADSSRTKSGRQSRSRPERTKSEQRANKKRTPLVPGGFLLTTA